MYIVAYLVNIWRRLFVVRYFIDVGNNYFFLGVFHVRELGEGSLGLEA